MTTGIPWPRKGECWNTSDGQVWARRREAEKREVVINLQKVMEDNGVCSGGEWSQDMIIDFMISNVHVIARCLDIIRLPDEPDEGLGEGRPKHAAI